MVNIVVLPSDILFGEYKHNLRNGKFKPFECYSRRSDKLTKLNFPCSTFNSEVEEELGTVAKTATLPVP